MKDAIEFVKAHSETVGHFTATRFDKGEKQETETRHNYQPVIEWLEKFPKYVHAYNLKTGKILIANILYKF